MKLIGWQAICNTCKHSGKFPAGRFQTGPHMKEVAQKLVCSKCGARGAYITALWHNDYGKPIIGRNLGR